MWEQNRRQEEALTVGEAWLRSEDEAEGGRGTANGSLLLVGWGGAHTRVDGCRSWGEV